MNIPRRTIRRWTAVGFVFAILWTGFAVACIILWFTHPQEGGIGGGLLFLLLVTPSWIGIRFVLKKQYNDARRFMQIGGWITLPLGLIMVLAAKMIYEASLQIESGVQLESAVKGPSCYRCTKPLALEPRDLSDPMQKILPATFLGTVCKTCRTVECYNCRGGVGLPCSACGEGVMPVYESLFKPVLEAQPTLAKEQSESDEVQTALRVMQRHPGALDYFVSIAGEGKLAAVEAMLAHSADPNHFDAIGRTALHAATQQGHTEVVRVLLKNGSNPNLARRDGWTPTEIAQCLPEYLSTGRDQILQLLREAGATE